MVFITRASWSLVMIFSFLFIVTYFQQPGCALLVFLLQICMYQELININIRPDLESQCRMLNFVLWWWFGVVALLSYGSAFKFIDLEMEPILFWLPPGLNLYSVCFISYIAGLLVFISTIRRRLAKYQLQRFALSHVVLILITAQSTAMVSNMFEGLIWFLLPASFVICNDIWAFISGFFLGRTPLISLSPKKTWEGFLGGFIATIIFGFLFTRIFSSFPLMTCRKSILGVKYWPSCDLDYPFIAAQNEFFTPLERHMFVLMLFSSTIAPFGGFFASGFKRAFKIKDFGTLIPGHGGFVDRMDCQIMMGMFVLVYVNCFIIPYKTNQGKEENLDDLFQAITDLSADMQREIFKMMGNSLVEDGLI